LLTATEGLLTRDSWEAFSVLELMKHPCQKENHQ
jgi:hypothetical protein